MGTVLPSVNCADGRTVPMSALPENPRKHDYISLSFCYNVKNCEAVRKYDSLMRLFMNQRKGDMK